MIFYYYLDEEELVTIFTPTERTLTFSADSSRTMVLVR